MAMALLVMRGVWSVAVTFLDSPYGLGRTTGLLSAGQAVVLSGEFHAALASQAIRPTGRTDDPSVMYDWGPTPTGAYHIASGTPGIVTIDPAWDEDSCYANRPIAVKLAGGPHQRLELAVPRRLLRKP